MFLIYFLYIISHLTLFFKFSIIELNSEKNIKLWLPANLQIIEKCRAKLAKIAQENQGKNKNTAIDRLL